jgi:hypothetical protein
MERRVPVRALIRSANIEYPPIVFPRRVAAAKDVQIPTDWAYLALAHARKGQLAEARQMLERLRERHPDSSLSFWDLQEIALLRSEAETLLGSRKEEIKK